MSPWEWALLVLLTAATVAAQVQERRKLARLVAEDRERLAEYQATLAGIDARMAALDAARKEPK